MIKRLLPYIFLNILISALTTLLVLSLWERARQPSLFGLPTAVPQPVVLSSPEATTVLLPKATPTLPPLDPPLIMIEGVLAAGDLEHEAVLLKRLGDGDLWLGDWRLTNGRDQVYRFPDLLLSKNGSIRVYTRRGNNTVIELFWGLDAPLWHSGDRIRLLDSQGNLRAEYTIP